MRILMLSRDGSGLAPDSATAARWRLLRDSGVELVIKVAAKKYTEWKDKDLEVASAGGNTISKWLNLYKAALAEIKKNKFNLITAQDPFELGWMAYRLARRARVKFEVQDHGGFFDGEKADEPFWLMRRLLAGYLARRAHAIRTVSPKSYDWLKKAGLGNKTYLLSIAAEERFKNAVRKPEPQRILSVGRLVGVKRFDLLISAFAEYKKNNPGAKLAILGEGPERKRLAILALKLGVTEDLEMPGAADPLPYLERTELFVLLSRHEGWGVAAVEARYARVPVLMTDTGCAQLIGARVVPVGLTDPVKLAQAMQTVRTEKRPDFSALTPEQAAEAQISAWKSTSSGA